MSAAIIIGAGPGVGRSAAQRFARERFDIGLIARRRSTVDAIAAELHETGVRVHSAIADAGDEPALRAALDELVTRLGVPDVVVYNAAVIQWDAIGELTAAQHLQAWAVNVVGAITAADRLLPAMADRATGTFIVTGGMPAPVPQVISLSLGKAGVRALVELLDTQYGPSGVHIATVTVAGAVAPGTALDPDAIADEYWRLHAQPPGARERETTFYGRAQDQNTPTPSRNPSRSCSTSSTRS